MSFAVTAISMQGIGAFSSAFGAANAAQGQKDALNFQANMAEINARMAEQSAQSTLLAGQRQQQRVMLQAARTKSSQKVALAANGIDIAGSDLSARLLASTQFMAETDALTINSNATQQAEAIRMQKVNMQNEANLKRTTASNIDPDMAMTTSLIGSAGNIASSWYMMNKYDAFPGQRRVNLQPRKAVN